MSGNGNLATTQASSSNSNFSLLSILSKEKSTGPNYMEWIRNLKMTIRYEGKEYVLKKPIVELDHSTATPNETVSYNKHSYDVTKVACIMVATMAPELAKFYEDYWTIRWLSTFIESSTRRRDKSATKWSNLLWHASSRKENMFSLA